MSYDNTLTGTQSTERLPQEQQDLMNLVSDVAAQAARGAIESAPLEFTQPTQQGVYTGQTLPQAHAQRAQQPQAQRGQATSPSFSQQATSPQLSAFQQQASQAQAQQQYSPAVDVIESNEEVHIFADLPGVDSDSIEVQASNNTISLSAERIEREQEDQQGNPVMAERGKVMQRQIQLPAECDVDDASATWDKGVVTITLPKVEAESTQRIGVE
ncbi:Molecular chaperone IbpA, HSP20 family [Halovenus aranensis]|uniref:Molecular chaperone IbpA, HSP20 family n=1 Tax=Halovenus aranensis TaxID=890420 RepID=A0A1G8SL53_9EURY|nr:Hsp20/alpha crystallin family protein [Halovenus aranensis]SDJ29904.1 Molecular chaperone IbpA, HSP20 family [Halovenus aranensis]